MARAEADRGQAVWIAIIAIILIAAAAFIASSVIAPLALALFIIAMVWPVQRTLERTMPKLVALALTILGTIAVCLLFAYLVGWGFGRVGRALIADAARYQAIYDEFVRWLEGHGISVAGVWAENFNVAWMLRTAQHVTGRLNTTVMFWVIAFVYVMLGLLEVDDMSRKVNALKNREAARIIAQGCISVAAKIRRYMWVRTQMSLMTGLFVWLFAWAVGLQFAAEWGVIAFALNYIPFIGPFIATFFPSALAILQFGSWQAAVGIFICLNIIQFVIGSYLEPRIAGNALSLSPTLVLFAVFLGAFIWGLFGAFIGVPIAIAIIAFCEQHSSTRWIAEILGAPPEA
ncbi:MAG: AI-2E family transporter [Rhizobiales bacterium]|nr:AI-2E family transporter [Hyphomicrobiales bacterium]